MSESERPILVTGAAGFIGFHTVGRLLDRGDRVVGIDNLNDYYSVRLKQDRLAQLTDRENFTFHRLDLADGPAIERLVSETRPKHVINLAAQVGVRNSLDNPHAYVTANVVGFLNLLEACRKTEVEHLVYASSSSVYGANAKLPFSTADGVDYPMSLYAATKKADELMAHAYSHLYRMPTTGLRFFTVYGPWGRPDMALFLFTQALFEGRPIPLFNEGRMLRDFTYVDDTVSGLIRATDRVPTADNGGRRPDAAPLYRIYNIGNCSPVEVRTLISVLEGLTGRRAIIDPRPMQPGEAPVTFADVSGLMRDVAFAPSTPLEEGAAKFVEWYRQYYRPDD